MARIANVQPIPYAKVVYKRLFRSRSQAKELAVRSDAGPEIALTVERSQGTSKQMSTTNGEIPDGPKLNLGCGPVQPEDWVNVDGSNRAWLASRFNWADNLLVKLKAISPTEFSSKTRYCNLFKGIPYPDNSVACVYAGELWEHFEYPDAEKLTREVFRVLKPKGVLRICVPDGAEFWGKYMSLLEEEMAKPPAQRSAKRLREHVQMFFNDICTRKKFLGSMGHTHKWNFDEVQLIELLENCGFSPVERRAFHDSRIPDVRKVERSDFLIVEGVKP